MRRVMMAILGTIVGTTLLVGLKATGSSPSAGIVADAPFGPFGAPQDSGQPAPGQTATPGQTLQPATTTPAAGQTTTRPGTTTTTQPGGGATTTIITTTAPPSGQRTLTGTAIAVRTARTPNPKGSNCGDCHSYVMQVQIVVTGTHIDSIAVGKSPSSIGESLQYYNDAVNKLKPLALAAQNWNVGKASGATYSSNAFELSLQSAMSQI